VGLLERQNLGGGVLGNGHNVGCGVGCDHAWEDTGINNKDVVSTVHLSVQVDDRCAAVQTTVRSDLGCAHPVVGTTLGGGLVQLEDVSMAA
jgi:hypothetical protein